MHYAERPIRQLPRYSRGVHDIMPNYGWNLQPIGNPDRERSTLRTATLRSPQGYERQFRMLTDRNMDYWEGGGQWSRYLTPYMGRNGWGWGPR